MTFGNEVPFKHTCLFPDFGKFFKYTFQANDKQGTEPVVRFAIKTRKQKIPKDKGARKGLEVVSLNSSGEAIWSLQHGNLKKISEKMKMEVRYSQIGRKQARKKGGMKIFLVMDKTIEEIESTVNP